MVQPIWARAIVDVAQGFEMTSSRGFKVQPQLHTGCDNAKLFLVMLAVVHLGRRRCV